MGKTIQASGFPSSVSAEQAKKILETLVGEGKVAALKLRQFKSGAISGSSCWRRSYAIVQFESERDARRLFNESRTTGTIWYGSSYLKIRKMDYDIIPKQRKYFLTIEGLELSFGCQVSLDKFLVLWRGRDVRLNVEFGLRKLIFNLVHNYIEYKVELAYGNIWQIEQRQPRGLSTKYMLIQLFGAPRIFKKVSSISEDLYDFKDAQDDQYVRTTDFTGSCIGQSSGLCLEVPSSFSLSYFKQSFPYYKEKKEPFILEYGSSFCAQGQFVPLVVPVGGIRLPFAVLFKVNMLVQNGCLAGPTLGTSFFQLLDPRKVDISCIEYALEKLFYLKECCYDPVSWLAMQYRGYNTSRKPRPAISLDGGLVYIRRVQVTPCKVYFCGPEVNVSNWVLRMFPDDLDDFIRVSFVDEDLEKLYSTDLSPRISGGSEGRQTAIYHRILSTLENGIVVGNKHFEFLAFSSSQLRENSLWMFASRPGLSAAQIRERLGDFSRIKNVAKYAARLGQSLSSSTQTLTVERHEMEIIPDVEIGFDFEPNKYIFSDGIGKISFEFAKKVARKCVQDSHLPSAFQIRYGGFKGVVAIDPTSTMKLSLRKSMSKYESEETKLDVLAYSKYQPCFLNRQIISLLSTLGVKDNAFEKKQKEAVDRLDAILTDPLIAQEALDQMSPGENSNILKHMIGCGYKPDAEPYLSMMLQVFRTTKLLELRTRTRIFVPEGRSMMGCMDETRTLEYGQVFLQASSSRVGDKYERHVRVIKGLVVVAKNPCLHPGDVRVLWAVDVPALRHMVDCVVFPQKGKRPHPNECSGSDLDGDIYFVSWDPDLIPPIMVEPMNYTPADAKVLDHEVQIEEVQEYFANYIVNDSLGIIANAHTVFADKEPGKAMSEPCIELAKLFSIAVDFNKTGVPAVIPQKLYVKEYPDFMEKADKVTYESPNVIGKLFRQVKDRAPDTCSIKSFTLGVAERCYDPEMEYPGFEDHLEEADYYKSQYDFKLGNLMDYYGIKSEAEILSGNVVKMSRSFNRRKDADSIGAAVRALRKEARSWIKEGNTVINYDDEAYAKASAWYYVTYHKSYYNCSENDELKREHLISFPWCVHEKLVQIKKLNANIRRRSGRANVFLLEDQFRRDLSLF